MSNKILGIIEGAMEGSRPCGKRNQDPSVDVPFKAAQVEADDGEDRGVSVAFRRESDEEHKEPRFELPIPPGPNLVTVKGLSQTEARVAELEALVAAEQDQLRLEEAKRDLRYWRTRLVTAELAPSPPEGEAGFGSRVTISHKAAIRNIEIVGDDEAQPGAGRIAFSAPLARALIGACVGDLVDFGGEADAIEILAISSIEG